MSDNRDLSRMEIFVDVIELVPPPDRPHGPVKAESVNLQTLGGRQLEVVVDADLDKFAEFYGNTLANGKLSPFERAAIKTYLHWKTHPGVR